MKLSDFVLEDVKGSNAVDWVFIASVTVTTGMLWWQRTQRRTIRRRFAGCWYFEDTGQFTPDSQAECLERAFAALHNEVDLYKITRRDNPAVSDLTV